ncbi:MAG: hypothetical protein ACRDPH_11510 [Marmoricola sp.]
MNPEQLRQELRAQARAATPPPGDRLAGVRRRRGRVRRTRGAAGIVAVVVAVGLLVGLPRLVNRAESPTRPIPAAPAHTQHRPPTSAAPTPMGRWQSLPPMQLLHRGRYYHQADGANRSVLHPGGSNRTMNLYGQPRYRLVLAGTLHAPHGAGATIVVDGRPVRTVHGTGLVLVDLRGSTGWGKLTLSATGPLSRRESLVVRAYKPLRHPTAHERARAVRR